MALSKKDGEVEDKLLKVIFVEFFTLQPGSSVQSLLAFIDSNMLNGDAYILNQGIEDSLPSVSHKIAKWSGVPIETKPVNAIQAKQWFEALKISNVGDNIFSLNLLRNQTLKAFKIHLKGSGSPLVLPVPLLPCINRFNKSKGGIFAKHKNPTPIGPIHFIENQSEFSLLLKNTTEEDKKHTVLYVMKDVDLTGIEHKITSERGFSGGVSKGSPSLSETLFSPETLGKAKLEIVPSGQIYNGKGKKFIYFFGDSELVGSKGKVTSDDMIVTCTAQRCVLMEDVTPNAQIYFLACRMLAHMGFTFVSEEIPFDNKEQAIQRNQKLDDFAIEILKSFQAAQEKSVQMGKQQFGKNIFGTLSQIPTNSIEPASLFMTESNSPLLQTSDILNNAWTQLKSQKAVEDKKQQEKQKASEAEKKKKEAQIAAEKKKKQALLEKARLDFQKAEKEAAEKMRKLKDLESGSVAAWDSPMIPKASVLTAATKESVRVLYHVPVSFELN